MSITESSIFEYNSYSSHQKKKKESGGYICNKYKNI